MLIGWRFFIHNNKGSPMKGLRMNFKQNIAVMHVFRRLETAPIYFNPKGFISKKISITFLLEKIMNGESNIGIDIEVEQEDGPPVIESLSWITDDGTNSESPFDSSEIDQINDNYFRT